MYLLLDKYLVCIMKRYRKISYVLGGILFLVVGMLAFQVYESGMEERRICKQKAEVSLKPLRNFGQTGNLINLEFLILLEEANRIRKASSVV